MKRFVQHTVTLGSRVTSLTFHQHQKLRGLASAVGGTTSDDARGGWPYAAGALFAAALGYSGWQHDENLSWLRVHADAAQQPAAEAGSSDRAAAFNTWLRGKGADFVAVNVASSQVRRSCTQPDAWLSMTAASMCAHCRCAAASLHYSS
jgi:hypothetical protein